jgi:hypothetical protein
MYKIILSILFLFSYLVVNSQQINYNPIIPDMIADPSVVEIDGTFYCYATTDGYGHGLKTSGPPVVWKSKDFINWSFKGTIFPSALKELYWAPSTVHKINNKYYFYPTVNRSIYAAVADSPEGPFRLAKGNNTFQGVDTPKPLLELKAPKNTKGIDAEVFIDEDGKAYMYWAQRGAARLQPDMITLDSTIVIPTKRSGYSEGPFLFKRKGIYYYLYTLSGNENYQYAYMMSHVSPLGPWESPVEDIITTTNHTAGIFGPGHGSVFSVRKTGNYYFAYLEFGSGGTNRQVYVDKLEFNADSTIKPLILTHQGVGVLLPPVEKRINLANGKKCFASSFMPDFKVKPIKDSTLNRITTFKPENALDNSNGTCWLAADADTTAWFEVDLGRVKKINKTEAYFVKPTAGHAYKLEYSLDGKNWKIYAQHSELRIQSPHADQISISTRYLKMSIIKGTSGLWEFKVY